MFDFVEGAELRMLKEALVTHMRMIDKKISSGRCDPTIWLNEKEIYDILYKKVCDEIDKSYNY